MLNRVLESCKTDLKQEEIKELVAGSYQLITFHRSTFSKLEIQRKVGIFKSNLGWYSVQLDIVHQEQGWVVGGLLNGQNPLVTKVICDDDDGDDDDDDDDELLLWYG